MAVFRNYLNLILFCCIGMFPVLKAEEESNQHSSKLGTNQPTKEKNKENTPKNTPPKIGNFALPASQQPSALFGFGGNIIDKGEVQIFSFVDGYYGKKRVATDTIPSILFGITDKWSVYFNFPTSPYNQDGRYTSKGLMDFFIQFEYAFYIKSTSDYIDQATLVGNIAFPTGSSNKNPHTGAGAPSYFLGATYYHSAIDWFFFTAPGAILPGSNHGTKYGDQFLYQFGFGKNFPSPPGWIYAWLLELDGQYSKKDRIHGHLDPNSGGNWIYVTPSLWISSKEMLFQFGVSLPINQNLFGKQRKFDYGFDLNFAWSFY